MTMHLYTTDTGVYATLSIVDPATGCDYAEDLIGNAGGLTDGQFVWDRHAGLYRCTQDTYDSWSAVLDAIDALEHRISDLTATYGYDAVHRVIADVANDDLDDYAREANEALDEAFGELD